MHQSRPISNFWAGPCSLCFVMVQNPGHSQLFHYCQSDSNINAAIWEEPIFFTWQQKTLFFLTSLFKISVEGSLAQNNEKQILI